MDPKPRELFLDKRGSTFALQMLQNTGKLQSPVSYSYILTYSLLSSMIFQESGLLTMTDGISFNHLILSPSLCFQLLPVPYNVVKYNKMLSKI